MSDGGWIAGERVFCHECSNEWPRDQGGLQCPRCNSEFIEIVTQPLPQAPPPVPSPGHPRHPLRDHNPWENEDYPDPDEGDINTVHFNTRLGNGTISFTSRTFTSGGARSPFGARNGDPASAEVGRDFNSLLESIMGGPRTSRTTHYDPFSPMGGMGMFPLPPGGRRNSRQMEDPELLQSPFGPMFSAIFSTMHNVQPMGQGYTRAGGPEMPPNPLLLLQQLMNPGSSQHGDAVFTQEALDRVISQLMEQNAGSNAPPPAAEADIASLPKKPVDASMLGTEGKAECSICMDGVSIGDEVTFLPCNHWFHGQCVTAWLKEHDTCPHCRASISKPSEQPNTSQPGSSSRFGSRRRSSRRNSSLSSVSQMPGGSRNMPGSIPESPPPDHRDDLYHDSSRRPQTARRAESHRSGSSAGSGGVTNWFRRQFGNS